MRTMNRKALIVLSSLAALPATIAMAADKAVVWSEVSSQYDNAAKTAAQPTTEAGYARCAGYWSGWRKAIDDGALRNDDLAQLPAALKAIEANRLAEAWEAYLDRADDPDFVSYKRAQTEANAMLAEGLTGKPESVSAMVKLLAGCTVLPK